jgi:hypothetical protein
VFSDSFDRTDSQTIGNSWQQSNGAATDWGIGDGQVFITSNNETSATMYATRSVSACSACDEALDVFIPSEVNSRAFLVLSSTHGSYFESGWSGYFALLTGTGIIQLSKRTGDTSTVLGEVSGLTVEQGSRFEMHRKANGDIVISLDGEVVLTRNDSAITSFTVIGFYVRAMTGQLTTSADNFDALIWS